MSEGTEVEVANRRLLFVLSNLAIFMIGLGFAVRAAIAGDLQGDLFNVLDLARSATMVGEVLAATFIGFALTLLFGAVLVDLIGMRHMLLFAAASYFFGSIAVVGASFMQPSTSAYWLVYGGLLLTGLGWGAVETATNPLIAAIYPEEKTPPPEYSPRLVACGYCRRRFTWLSDRTAGLGVADQPTYFNGASCCFGGFGAKGRFPGH